MTHRPDKMSPIFNVRLQDERITESYAFYLWLNIHTDVCLMGNPSLRPSKMSGFWAVTKKQEAV